jgi:hypothetical protein
MNPRHRCAINQNKLDGFEMSRQSPGQEGE